MTTRTTQNQPPTGAIVWFALAGWILLAFAASALGAFFQPGVWYEGLNKPVFNPPGWVFGPVWFALYLAMGTAAWLVWRKSGFRGAALALGLYMCQLVLNALWTPVFFGLQQPGAAFAIIVAMWVAIALTIVTFWKHSRVAAGLLVPYLLWVSFASVLNFSLWQMN